ncbi:gluconate 2-dehydrogenase subunit 3 family protein [Lentiprolixibacter aurantiacus]|uniref:Gluconate 2-dehydrogenase subunit 3 family protein n=1 Tax=Lentiprolixibacter aurantiacus TaxID=2993939 RepID=A0AAE3MID1_9FLAO|nr:gluconate 2-dehydrogenase subunit 3 family protein [Lentiprolixibacter aurantiacus]MCX2718128.1 gluconate 2-dehydrogenase subunit 3 family protein [Lentiprolixibacter aurantiacus]
MKNDKNLSRREFSKAVISAQLLLASGFLTVHLACKGNKDSKAGAIFNPSQKETLSLATDEIIPANKNMPSASEVGSLQYVTSIIEEMPELAPLFNSLIDEIESQSANTYKAAFASLNREQRIEVLKNLEQSSPELFNILKDFTYESYYTNEKVYSLIKYEPHPTGTSGPDMEPFDEKLLERVKNIPPMYTKI